MSTFENFGKYVLLEKLATGGMAEVFLARGSGAGGIGKFFAIKRILPQYADSPEFIEMFKAEAKIAINLSHNNIVSIHEFGVEKGQFFLVMDYVEGRNLRQILNKMKKSGLQFSIDQIIYIFKEVAAGLDHAHRCIDGTTGKPLNITHRDMSPQNVMLSFEGEVKVVDFGIAKAESQIETTRAGTLKGKFGYMSPEQAEGLPVDLRTDIFSLGIVLWELLANDRLFVANNEINTLRKIRDCQIPSLRKVNPNIHTELERIVQKSLARDRNLRYQTGAALHRDLNRFLNRQYPDFSSQDFAVFIKSVFADEILSLRKRLVDYSKVSTANSASLRGNPNFDDRTSLLDNGTTSLVVSEEHITNSEINENTEPGHDIANEKSATKWPATDSSSPTGKIIGPVDTSTPRSISGKTGTMPLVLDEKALAVEGDRRGDEGTATGISQRTRTSSGRTKRHRDRSRNRSGSMRVATLIVFCLLFLSVYAYLVKYFTPLMSDVIATTDPIFHTFHVALGVEPNSTANSSYSEPRSIAAQSPSEQAMPTIPAPTHAAPPPVESTPEVEDVGAIVMLTVTTNPSGASIWVDNKSTGMVTPSRIEVPSRKKFSVSLRKRGYASYQLNNVTKEQVGSRITARLLKQNVAFVDVDVFPPQDVVITVNGKSIRGRLPLHDVEIQANMPVKIRAEARNGGSFDETTVNMPPDKHQTIQLNPRKNQRIPSNSPNQ